MFNLDKLSDFQVFLVGVGLSVLTAWFMMFPLVDFLTSKAKTPQTCEPAIQQPVRELPRVNELMPCDDTDCLLQEI